VIPLITILIGKVRRHAAVALVALATLSTLLGAGLFALTQNVSFGTGLYWAITTATTVGYGDVTPHNTAGRVIAVGVMLTAIPLFGAIFALLAAVATAARLRRLFGLDYRLPDKGYVAVYGMDPSVECMLSELGRAGRAAVLAADVDPGSLGDHVHLVKGDPTEEQTVLRTHPERASQAFVTGASDADVLVTAVLVHHAAPDLEVLASTGSPKIASALRDLGITRTIASDELLGHTLAKSLEAPHAADLLLGLVASEDYRLSEVPVEGAAVGKRLSDLRREHSGLVLGLVHESRVLLGVGSDPTVDAADHLLVMEVISGPADGQGGPLG
jgi:voltage-gated potassium channel